MIRVYVCHLQGEALGFSIRWGDEVHFGEVLWLPAAAEGELQVSNSKYTLELQYSYMLNQLTELEHGLLMGSFTLDAKYSGEEVILLKMSSAVLKTWLLFFFTKCLHHPQCVRLAHTLYYLFFSKFKLCDAVGNSLFKSLKIPFLRDT